MDGEDPNRRPKKRRQVSVSSKHKKIRLRMKEKYQEIKVKRQADRAQRKANGAQQVRTKRAQTPDNRVLAPAGTRFSERLRVQNTRVIEEDPGDVPDQAENGDQLERMVVEDAVTEDDEKEGVEEEDEPGDELPARFRRLQLENVPRRKKMSVELRTRIRKAYDRDLNAKRMQRKKKNATAVSTFNSAVTLAEFSPWDMQFQPGASTSRNVTGNLEENQDSEERHRKRKVKFIRERSPSTESAPGDEFDTGLLRWNSQARPRLSSPPPYVREFHSESDSDYESPRNSPVAKEMESKATFNDSVSARQSPSPRGMKRSATTGSSYTKRDWMEGSDEEQDTDAEPSSRASNPRKKACLKKAPRSQPHIPGTSSQHSSLLAPGTSGTT